MAGMPPDSTGRLVKPLDVPFRGPPTGFWRWVFGGKSAAGSNPGPPPNLQRLDVKPGDKFVMTIDERLSAAQTDFLRIAWREFIGGDTEQSRLFILDGGATLGVLRVEDGSKAPPPPPPYPPQREVSFKRPPPPPPYPPQREVSFKRP